MRKILSWLVLAPIFAVILSFAVSNREILTLHLWPTDLEVSAPLFTIALGGIFLGFFWGAVTVWLSGAETRRRARREAARANDAEREAERLRAEINVHEEQQHSQVEAERQASNENTNLPAVAGTTATSAPRIL